MGLGVYVPALLIQRQMARLGVPAEVEVLEGYYTLAAQRRQLAHRRACRDNFALAQMAHRMARGVDDCLDGACIAELFGRWAAQQRCHFMVWSGFWLPLLERYRDEVDMPLQIDCCRIDAEVSASFRVHEGLARGATEIWLWSWAQKRTVFEIPVDDRAPLAFAERERRIVVHGGGWGLGTYRARLDELSRTPWSCDMVVHERAEATHVRGGDRCFIVDPEWQPWERRDGRPVFPPFAEVACVSRCGRAFAADGGHALFDTIRRSKAIVSKPGGGTLIDSLASATPVVLLEPYGYAEASNAALWRHLGFGISFEEWRDSSFSDEVLARLQENLRRRTRNDSEYPRAYVERIRGASA
ncbi:MAG: hypothetical protein JWM53_6987 [bacterium]|nr:hypothetical protein [bacterium]